MHRRFKIKGIWKQAYCKVILGHQLKSVETGKKWDIKSLELYLCY